MCLDEYGKPVTRRCISNFTSNAEWSAFNCSLCKKFYETVSDLQFQCPDGYFKLQEKELCYRIYNEKKNWNDAYKTCSDSSSYLGNDLYRDIELDRFWLSYKYNYGQIQGFGMRPINEILKNVKIKNPELHCVSAVLENNKYELHLENCSEEMFFVCIQNPYELVSSVKYAHTWTKFNGSDACYYFDNNPDYNRTSAIRTCDKMFHDAQLLQEMQNINDYQYLKKLIYQKNNKISCSKYTWWINATSVVNTRYTDWNPFENWSSEKQRTVTLFPDRKIYWTLAKSNSKLGLICDMQKCEDDRPTKAYIEDRSTKIPVSRNNFYDLRNFELKCIPSGWFVTSSIRWYKDGVLLLNRFDECFKFSYGTFEAKDIPAQEALKYQGYYSCSVDEFFPMKTVYSSEELFKITEYHTFVLSMVSKNETYLDECRNCMVNGELCKTHSLSKCFEDNFKHTLDKSFHFLIKNLTCNSTLLNITVHIYYEENYGKDEDILNEIKTADFHKFCETCGIKHDISSRSSDKCFSEQSKLKDVIVTWPTTAIGKKAYSEEKCVADGRLLERECLGDFNSGAVWSEVSADQCDEITSEITKGLKKLLAELLENNAKSLPYLLELTVAPEKLLPVDVQIIEQIFNNLANRDSLAKNELNIIVEVVSNLINASPGAFSGTGASSIQIIEHLEQMTSNVEVENMEINVTAENIHVNIYPFSSSTDNVPNCIILRNGLTEAFVNASSQKLQNDRNFDAGIILPQTLIAENLNASDRLVYTVAKDFPGVSHVKVLSYIVSATFPNISVYEYRKDEVTLFFKLFEEEGKSCSKKKKIGKEDSPECVYWDTNIRNWSYKGCFRRTINKDLVVCVCNHLSRFTVILGMDSVSVAPTHEAVLSYITYIGCSLSCFGFALIIVTFIIFRDFRKFLKNKTLFNYSISQFVFLLLFMTSIEQTNSKVYCKVAAVLSHYFLLSSFTWMIALAYTVYLSLVKVLGTYIPRLLQKLMAFAWGVPAIIVIIVLSINVDYYSRDNICWLCSDVIIYAITSPLIVMLIINYAIFGTIAYLNTCKKTSLRLNQERRKLIVTRIKALFCTSILLGLSWIFGILGLYGNAKLEFQYLFSITTPLQGFLLAISFVIRPKSTRDLWHKLLSPSTYSASPTIHSSTASNRVEQSRISRYENALHNVVFRAHSTLNPYG